MRDGKRNRKWEAEKVCLSQRLWRGRCQAGRFAADEGRGGAAVAAIGARRHVPFSPLTKLTKLQYSATWGQRGGVGGGGLG